LAVDGVPLQAPDAVYEQLQVVSGQKVTLTVNAKPTLDGGVVEQSNNAFFGREGQWWIENHGAEPDVRVENDPASHGAGHDRQLEVEVETLLKQLKERATETFPALPAYPVK
jgi:tricorn protease